MPGFTHIDGMTEGEMILRRVQADGNLKRPEPMKFPDIVACDKRCAECGRIYPDTTQEFCLPCGTYTVWPITEGGVQ